MAQLLYRLGRFSYRRRGRVVAIWGVILVLLGIGVATLGGSTSDALSIPGTEGQQALDDLRTDLPAASGATATLVVQAPEGQTLDADALAPVLQDAAALPEVVGVVDPTVSHAVSQDGRTGLVTVAYGTPLDGISQEAKDAFDEFGDSATTEKLKVVSGGELSQAPPEVGATEAIGVLVAAVVLVVTFGSLVAAGMTLLTAIIGLAVGMSVLLILTSYVDITSTAPILALMLGLAVGIDYALFISSRHRNNLADGLDYEESVARAVATAGSAVTFAGATVVIALVGLGIAGIPFLSTMGQAAAGTVLTAVIVAITLLPALLGFVGKRILPRKQRSGSIAPNAQDGAGFRWARGVIRFRTPVVIGGVVGLGLLAIPMLNMHLALPDGGNAPAGSHQRVAYDLTAEAFGPGVNGPLVIVVKGDTAESTAALAANVTSTVEGLDDVVAVQPGPVSESGQTQLITVIPASGPSTEETAELVRTIRDAVQPQTEGTSESIAITGTTAIGVDVSAKLAAALPIYLAVVIGLSFILLLIAFRSWMVPLKAAFGFLLTVGATFGLVVGVFQWGWAGALFGIDNPGPLVSFLPIIMIGILFGLAMDYEVFIVSRVREEFVHGSHATEATIEGVGHGARVVTAAALIMASVFGGFALVDDPTIKAIGFGLAVGVLIDAFVVRMTIVPAVLALLGDRAWSLPGWLAKITPNVDIEGANLRLTDTTPQADEPVASH
ncbi:MMPL family transporter [Cellulomonas sp. URHE0023]|uniref:MMPL family transporter n=1 Tax=Cellulomonas sp. URHE0023 TaxID=1380354 RepID=UPI000485165B|nr:MMPL family transporter [Cellulomonas sp. URHE0023]